jgi:RimJ/RimL family protein N-acetyltransferase
MVEHCREEAMQRFTSVPAPYTEDDATGWVELSRDRWRAGEAATFAIADATDDTYHGGIDLRSGPWPVGEIGYGLRAGFRRRGITTRALRLVAAWGIELGLVRLQLVTDVDNIASQRVAERAGFTREGLLRGAQWRLGAWHDLVSYACLREDA